MTTRTASRLISLASAAFLTVVILAGLDTLATSEPPAALLAQMAAMHKA
jgi:hypothetical protein